MKRAILSGIFIFASSLSFFIPLTANAGLFSFISDAAVEKVSAKDTASTNTITSQNMKLLEARSSDYDSTKIDQTDNSIIIAYGNALSPSVGPQGTAEETSIVVTNRISVYTVREGDTIESISKMFDVSVSTIILANELRKNEVINEGDNLVILPITGIRYVVRSGDTVRGIASRYKTSLSDLLKYNDLTISSELRRGDTIIIPDVDNAAQTATKPFGNKKNQPKSSLPFFPGYYTKPIIGGVISQGLHGRNAMDIAAPVGTSVRAAAEGEVVSSISNGGWNGGYGNLVIIEHPNGTKTLYAHLLNTSVKTGDTVAQGQIIAKVGMTGKTTGPHLHFEAEGTVNPAATR